MTNVVILGSTGMLGSAIAEVLSLRFGKVIEVNRTGLPIIKSNKCLKLDATQKMDFNQIFDGLHIDFIVNAIGMIKQVINEGNPSDLEKAHLINCEFVSKLNTYSDLYKIPVIQIGTDCVFSGSRGNYVESDLFEAIDVYSQTKIDGEKSSPSSMILRTSIIGREIRGSHSLLEWALSQKKNTEVNGFTNHIWNGVTTFHFAKFVKGIIESKQFNSGAFHVLPSGSVSKYELLKLISENFKRSDLKINKFEATIPINRTLATLNPAINRQIWAQAGYDIIPSIEEMVTEYASWLNRPRS